MGVTPMALYRHVDDRNALLAAVADRLLSDQTPPNRRLGWRRYLESLADSLRALSLEWPVLVEVFSRQPLTSRAATDRLEAAVAVLERDSFRPKAAIRAYAAVHTYTIGFCALEAGRASYVRRDPHSLTPAEDAIESFVTGEQFRHGLRALIAGLAP
jgi:AcrR family transcriptional regulator